MSDVVGIVNLHDEGRLAVASIRSAIAARGRCRSAGLECEIVLVLDRPDDLTIDVATRFQKDGVQLLQIDEGDLGRSRNAAVRAVTEARYVAFLDGDDLWDEGWLLAARRALEVREGAAVAHPRYTICFGASTEIWVAVDSTSMKFDPRALRALNYWSALSFAARDTYLEHPYNSNDFKSGWGYEDWEWNCRTLADGIPHISVSDGVHFVRKRLESLSRKTLSHRALPRPTALSRYNLLPSASAGSSAQHLSAHARGTVS